MPRGVNTQDEGRIQGRNVVNANSSNIVAPGIVTDGLVLHLDAGNYESYPIAGTTAYDLSESRTNGTLINGPTYARDGGGSISFDGTNDYASVPDAEGVTDFSVSNNYTIDFFLYINASQPTTTFLENLIMEKWGSYSTGYPYVFRFVRASTEIAVLVYNGTTVNNINISVSTNTWMHICGVFDWTGSLLSVYRDGGNTKVTTALNITGTISNSSPLYIADRGFDLAKGPLAGKLSNLKIYNRALTPTEVSQNFNALRSRFNI